MTWAGVCGTSTVYVSHGPVRHSTVWGVTCVLSRFQFQSEWSPLQTPSLTRPLLYTNSGIGFLGSITSVTETVNQLTCRTGGISRSGRPFPLVSLVFNSFCLLFEHLCRRSVHRIETQGSSVGVFLVRLSTAGSFPLIKIRGDTRLSLGHLVCPFVCRAYLYYRSFRLRSTQRVSSTTHRFKRGKDDDDTTAGVRVWSNTGGGEG